MTDVRKSAYRGSAYLMAGQVVVYGSSFLRNMMLARLLTKADFGTAAALAMVIQLLEFTTSLGVSRFVIREKEGGLPEFIASAHLMQWVAGFFSALVIVGASWPLSALFGLGDHHWAMAALAIIPLLNGFQHLDVRRYERDLRFGPSAMIEIVPQIVITLAAWPVALWLKDFRAMLLLLLVKAAATCVASHWLAEQPYRWGWNRRYLSCMLRMGWPLVVNGFLMFGALHGDQFLVATYYTMADLGPYTAAGALTMAPTFFFGRVFNSLMQPLMAKAQDDPVQFERRYRQAVAVLCTFAASCAAGLIVGAEAIMQLAYGPKYVGTGAILAALATANAFRNTRIAPALAAMAKGDTKNQMISSLWRAVALVPALAVAMTHQPVWMMACAGFIGEFLAGWVSMVRLERRDGIKLSIGLKPVLWVALVVVVSFVGGWMVREWNLVSAVGAAVGAGLAAGLLGLVSFAALRREVVALWTRRRGGEAAAGYRVT